MIPLWLKIFYNKKVLGKNKFALKFPNSISLDYIDDNYFWYKNNEFHKEDGPAIIYKSGNISYYINGKLHREDGPAIILYNGDKEWYINGLLHRLDSPAIERSYGHNEWWLKGKFISSTAEGYRIFMKLKAFM